MRDEIQRLERVDMYLWLTIENGEILLYGNDKVQARFESIEMAMRVFPKVKWNLDDEQRDQ